LVWSGGTAQFEVGAGGTDPLAYQWWFNQTNLLADATNAVLVLTNVGLSQEGWYSAVVMNLYGTAASSNAQLTVCAALRFTASIIIFPAQTPRLARAR